MLMIKQTYVRVAPVVGRLRSRLAKFSPSGVTLPKIEQLHRRARRAGI
jgi:hypothetical protein